MDAWLILNFVLFTLLYACLRVCTFLCTHAMDRMASMGKGGLGEIGNGMGGEKNVWICCL